MGIKKSILTSIAVIFHLISLCQNSLFSQFSPISINSCAWENYKFEEIKPFAKILEKHELLILSEAGHADGAAYDLQCKVIKALVDSGIVNTLYTESSWLNTEKISEVLKKYGKDSIEEVTKYLSSTELFYWTKNKFWNYLANQIIEGKIQLTGIDILTTSEKVMQELFKDAEIVLSKHEPSFQINPELKKDFLDFYYWNIDIQYDEMSFIQSNTFIKKVLDAYENEKQTYRVKQWKYIKDFLTWRYYKNFDKKGKRIKREPENPVEKSYYYNLRDSLMADIFYTNFGHHNRNKSILLIAAFHSMTNNGLIPKNPFRDTSLKNFGEHLIDKRVNFYSVCFTTASGKRGVRQFGREYFYSVNKPVKNSFEEYFQKEPFSVLFIDFSNSNGNDFYMNPLNAKYKKANWRKIFGGTFFIKEMYPMICD